MLTNDTSKTPTANRARILRVPMFSPFIGTEAPRHVFRSSSHHLSDALLDWKWSTTRLAPCDHVPLYSAMRLAPGWWNGRHGGLKNLWLKGRVGSTPTPGTTPRHTK